MMTEAEQIWAKLKYGPFQGSVIIHQTGDGRAIKFNSGWISESLMISVSVDDVAQSSHRDFNIEWNDIIFKTPPFDGAIIAIECYGQKD